MIFAISKATFNILILTGLFKDHISIIFIVRVENKFSVFTPGSINNRVFKSVTV